MPIIVLSVKGEEKTKVEALDAGADDYVTKPIGMDELLARVRRNLARTKPTEDASQANHRHWRFQNRCGRIPGYRCKNNEVRLTPKEFELLLYLARHAGRVVTHRTLLLAIWGPNSVEQPEHLRVLVGQLRKKIDAADTPRYIITEPWVGYRFEPAGEELSSFVSDTEFRIFAVRGDYVSARRLCRRAKTQFAAASSQSSVERSHFLWIAKPRMFNLDPLRIFYALLIQTLWSKQSNAIERSQCFTWRQSASPATFVMLLACVLGDRIHGPFSCRADP